MGITAQQYRSSIGLFDGRPKILILNTHRGLPTRFMIFWLHCLLTSAMQLQVDPWVNFLITIGMDVEKNPGPNYLTRDITFCNLNIRSLNAKPRTPDSIPRFTAFKAALAGTYDIITATESWLKHEHPDSDYIIPGYNGPYRKDRPDGDGHGGVIAWVSDNLTSKRRADLEDLNHETIWFQVGNSDKQVLICISYRQKLGNYSDGYWEKLQTGYDKAIATRIPNIIMAGDFNADPGTEKTASDTLDEFVAINNLTQHIKEPTRHTATRSSKLDLIMTNLPRLIYDAKVGTPVHENDHCTIFGTLNLKTITRKTFERDMWDFKNANFDVFREELGNVNWEECFESDDINEISEKWTNLFLKISNTVIPKKRVKVRPYDKNWYNNYLRRLRRIKDRDYRSWTRDKVPLNLDIYKVSRNEYFQECERIKREHEEHIYANLAADLENNPKKWWSLVGQTMGTSKKSNYPVMIHDNKICESDKDKAEAFNDTYVKSSTLNDDDFEVPDVQMELDHEPIEHIRILEKDVDDIIKCLDVNKAYGPDNVSPKLLKEARPSIVKVLTRIFNKSLELAKFPLIWKRANVLPIYKKAETFFTINYRPVSLLSILAKVFEKIVFKYLYNYFRTHFLISVWQSGFLPGSSTITQLVELHDQFCKAMNSGKEIRVVFLDISKAFDRVWHKGLLLKLRSCGITGRLLDWLKDYLTDRQQRVIINGEHSEWGNINAGVPQGSVLGPLLFLIFINDITHVIEKCKIRLFADDTCLVIEIDDPTVQAIELNNDLEKLREWAELWHVTFSPPKSEELLISNKRTQTAHPPLYLGDTPIKKVTQHKHLGLTISQNLTWNYHITEICDKANRRLGILRSLKYKLNRLSLERIYFSFIRPILEYGNIIWDKAPKELLDQLESIQVNAARIVVGATARSSTDGLYKETNWEPLSKRREQHRLSLMYNIVNKKAPTYLVDLLPGQIQDRTTYQLRNRARIDQPAARLNVYANSFYPSTIKAWNDLDEKFKSAPSIAAFKTYHARSLSKKNPLYYYGGRLESAIHARMRIENSPLRADLCNALHVIPSPLCQCGTGVEEDAKHYFFDCQLFDTNRQTLVSDLLPFTIDRNEYNHLLFGIPEADHRMNIHIFTAVHKFIRETRRFY
jgi:hypothetical protein